MIGHRRKAQNYGRVFSTRPLTPSWLPFVGEQVMLINTTAGRYQEYVGQAVTIVKFRGWSVIVKAKDGVVFSIERRYIRFLPREV